MLLAMSVSKDPDVAKKKHQDAEQQLSDNKDRTSGGFLGTGNGVTPTGQNLNHNETLVRDLAPNQLGIEGNLAMGSQQEFADARLFLLFLPNRTGLTCSPWICGSNHNETFVHDTARSQMPLARSRWLTPEQAATVAPVLIQLAQISGGCSPLVCGSTITKLSL
jgi:hypothetical protein